MLSTAVSVLHVVACIGLIASIIMQSGKSAGLSGAISGGAESYFGKSKGIDALLVKVSSVFAAVFLLSALGLAVISVS